MGPADETASGRKSRSDDGWEGSKGDATGCVGGSIQDC